MTTERCIALTSSSGNPKDPTNWSGTPSNIAQALEKLGVTVFGIDASLTKSQKLAYWAYHRGLGLGTDYARGRLARTASANIIQRQNRTLGAQKVLHVGTMDLPMSAPNPAVEHYLFCDSTWHLWSQYATNMDQYPPKMLRVAEQLEREAYAQVKHFFPISEYVRDNLMTHYQIEPQRITVVGTGRGKIEPFTGDKDYQNGPILFVAKTRYEDKGGPLLVEGFKQAQQQHQALKLVIVGQEPYRERLNVPNVTVTGFIPWKELQHLFNRAALFAMPSPNEPWGLVYLEALACKTPLLGLNRNSLPEITRHGQYGFLVDEPTPEAIAQAILEAFSEPQRLKAMGTAGQQFCLETFSWKQVAQKIAGVMFSD
ncbi:MAG: glycosyltransferase family 4 protein [Cyanophyceae cyanobacterium]